MEPKDKRTVIKLFVRNLSPEEIFDYCVERNLLSEINLETGLETIKKAIEHFKAYLINEYSCSPQNLKFAIEIESIKEAEKQTWIRKSPTNLIELKRMKIRLFELLKADSLVQSSLFISKEE